ncbi:MAG: hypothetical protein K2H56_03680 [Malacoplasma sp.]|nr:hypothetical protein [Malacoplasma sp.]
MEKEINIHKNIKDLKTKKEILTKQISTHILEKPELTHHELEQINSIKKEIKEIDDKIASFKKELEELYNNNKFECSYSSITENGKTTEVYKVNGNEVSRMDYFKALKENALTKRKMMEDFSRGLENFFTNTFFLDRPFFKEEEKEEKDEKDCECKKHHHPHHPPKKEKKHLDFFDKFFF